MRFTSLVTAALAASPAAVAAKAVFAHVIVGNVCAYTEDTWETDINYAKSAGIDGFVLNIAPPWDNNCLQTQLSYSFTKANELGDFKLFFSFDYLGGGEPWALADVVTILNIYGPNGAHFKYGDDNLPFVSTFEGTGNIGDWATIRSEVSGGIYFVPDWTSLGPTGFASYLSDVDGAFSWDMWPDGPNDVSTTSDEAWISAIGDKTYMMGVSPWFFTDLPGYAKAWVWRGDDAWHERWQQVYELQPDLVEIVSWNDYGESHYIGPIYDAGIPSASGADATWYVEGFPHDSWRDFLPYYIAQYKNDAPPTVTLDQLQYWYRTTPGAAGSNGGVTGNDCLSSINTGGYQTCYDPNAILLDQIYFTALLTSAATVTVQVGSNAAVSYSGVAGINNWSQDFNGQTGDVVFSIVRNGVTVAQGTGTAILASPANGQTNYNPWVGSASASSYTNTTSGNWTVPGNCTSAGNGTASGNWTSSGNWTRNWN